MIDSALLKLRQRDHIGPDEEQALRDATNEAQTAAARTTIIREGEILNSSTLLLDGIMCRYKDLRNGERQISALHVAGDFVDLHSFTLRKLDHNIMALTRCRFVTVAHSGLKRITENFPHLTRVFWFATNLDAAIHREWELSLGRRQAISKVAHLFCEMHVRLQIVGLASDDGYDLGLTQNDLAECVGLTPVHVNRTLKELRTGELVSFRSGRVTIHDPEGLKRIGEFDPAYLYLDHEER